jgi:hypothetical protein
MRHRVYLLRAGSVLVLVTGLASRLHAQYYEREGYQQPEARYFYAGFAQRDFAPRSSNPDPDSLTIAFNRFMPIIGLRQGSVDLMFGYTTYDLEGKSRSTIFFGANLSQEFLVAGGRSHALVMPVILSADFTKAQGVGTEREDFNIGSVGIGAGLKYHVSNESLDFSIQAGEIVHYSFEGLSTGSGFSAATVADAVLMLPGTLVLDGIVLGYRFRLQTWAMNDDQFNYRSISHGPYLGILF